METADTIAVAILSASLFAVVYCYAIYPFVVWLAAFVFKPVKRTVGQAEPPSVTVLISAHNEEDWIVERIKNLLALNYPPEKITIVIASDGSTDRTEELIEGFNDERVVLLSYSPNRGKSNTLNAAMAETQGEIIVFSDANTMFEPDALSLLVQHFDDETTGVVVGRLILRDAATGSNVDGIYWRYETFIKKSEAKLGALLGANGAIYAMRRDCFVEIPGNTIIDDFVIPLLAKLKHRCRIVYEPAAVAVEESAPHVSDEFWRRARIGAGGYQSLTLLWPLLSPAHGWTAFAFFSHKVLRWFSPFFLLSILVCNVFLVEHWLFQIVLAVQLACYGTALLGWFVPGRNIFSRGIRLSTMFASMNLALLVGFWRWLTTPQTGAWKRTARLQSVAGENSSNPPSEA